MPNLLLAAAAVMVLTGLAHSVIGERLIFSRLREGGIVPTLAPMPLKERHVRILWASWHLVTLLGWALAAILVLLPSKAPGAPGADPLLTTIVVATAGGSALVLWATRGRHPGWIALLAAAILTWTGS
jgi:hypothetical protein